MAVVEIPKEMVDKIYEIIEVAKSTGKIKKGKAKFVAVAKDVEPAEIIMHIPMIAEEKNVPCFMVPSKEELGAAAGIQVTTGSVAVILEGEAKNLIKDLVSKAK